VFGVTEYEFLHLLDNEMDESSDHSAEDEEHIGAESDVENRLNQLAIKKKPNNPMFGPMKQANEQTNILTYKYFFLQMRTDVCIDSVTLETFTRKGFMTDNDKFQSVQYKTVEQKVTDNIRKRDVKDIQVNDTEGTKKEANISKQNNNNASNTILAPKESILVQISNRVKSLEKNLTAQVNTLKTFNSSSKQQGNDINKILETILKAKEAFEETTQDTETVKDKVKTIDQKIARMESTLMESSEMMKLVMAITIVLAITCLFLISIICFSPTPHYVVTEEDEENEDLTVRNTQKNYNPPMEDVSIDEPIAGCSSKPKKKVTFSDDEGGKDSDEDINRWIDNPHRRINKKEPRRRVTWCGGSFRKLAEDAAALVAKEM